MNTSVVLAKPQPKVYQSKPNKTVFSPMATIPSSITENKLLDAAIERLPKNYNFEVQKTIWRIQRTKAETIALQLPEGLLVYATTLVDIIEEFTDAMAMILGDVTYGACCIDDLSARALDCDLVVHYGHSCLVPVPECVTDVLYVFVDIKFDPSHFLSTLKANFDRKENPAVFATIQFTSTLQELPLSKGEVLGCTAPRFSNDGDENPPSCMIFLGDGRFHFEAAMMANPEMRAFRYDPYSKKLTQEYHDMEKMLEKRQAVIEQARPAKHWGIVLGTLGRQGHPRAVQAVVEALDAAGLKYTICLLSEIFPAKLSLFEEVDAWVEAACPRLAIDWGYAFFKPLLTPHEALVALGTEQWTDKYPIDNYSKKGGRWNSYHPLVSRRQRNKMAAKSA